MVLYIVTGAPRSSEPLPAASAVQVSSIVHVLAFVSNTQDSGLLACFVITNPHSSARQRGLRVKKRSKPTLAKPTLAKPTLAKPTLAKVKVLVVCKDFGFFGVNCLVFF